MTGVLAVALNPTIDISCEADRVQPTLKVRTHNQLHEPGGGGTNVARVVAILGGKPELAFLSGGATGALYEELLDGRGIALRRFAMQGPVRIAFMAHETSTSLEYRFVPEGPVLTETEAAPLLEFAGRFDGDFIVASGSLPRGLASDSYARIAQAAHQKGVKFVLDTSGDALRVTLEQSKVFLVKPSIGELEKLCGHQLDECGAEAAAADLVGRGAADYVEVSMGRHGALLVSGEGVLRAPALHVKTVSAVGAGDSFVGAMTWALSEGKTIQEAFLLGSAAGAAAVMSPGTGLCRREDVFALYDKISKLQFTRPS